MKSLILLCLLCSALLFVGCASSEQSNSNNMNKPTAPSPASSSKPAAAGAADTSTSGTTFGVAACDEYMAKVEKCVNSPNVPEAAKAAYRQSLEQNRTAWRQAASTPQGKASLETSCQTALASARTFLDTCK